MNGRNKSEVQMVLFRLSNQNYGVSIDSVYEVISTEQVTRVPKTPDFIEGVINLRGNSIPVIDLLKCLGFEKPEETDSSRIIVMDVGGTRAGFIVDEVLEVIRVSNDCIQPAPQLINSVKSEYLKGIALLDEKMVIILDINNLLQHFGTESLAAVQEKLEVM